MEEDLYEEEYLWGRTYREEKYGRQDSFDVEIVLHRSPTVGALVSVNSQCGKGRLQGNYGSNDNMYFTGVHPCCSRSVDPLSAGFHPAG